MEGTTKRAIQAQETKKKIFDAAISLFSKKAYEDVKISEICLEAGTSIGAFYHHYENKESILNEGYRLFDDILAERWEQGHPEGNQEAIRFLVSIQLSSMETMGSKAAAQYFKNQLTNAEKYVLNPQRFFNAQIKSCVEAEITAGVFKGDANLIANQILGLCRGLIYDWCLHEGSYSLSEAGEQVLDMILLYVRI